METESNSGPGDTKWNNEQGKKSGVLNEGFSGENIPDNYNPSDETISNRMKTEHETDQNGNDHEVKRSRYTDNQ